MSRSLFKDWQRTRFKAADSRCVWQVFAPAGDDRWPALIRRYAEGRLAGLQAVPASQWARVQCLVLPGDDTVYYLKHYLMRNRRDRLKHLLRPSRCRRALASGLRASAFGFRVPVAVCLAEARRWGMVTDGVLVTRGIPDAPDLRSWLRDPALAEDREARRGLLRAFGREVGAWHRSGLYHGDLRIGNVLCRRLADGTWRFFWLDNERNRTFIHLPLRRRVHNLSQINMERHNVSRADRLRFWRSYEAAAGIALTRRKKIMRRVMARTQRRWRKRGWL